jgi:hypothetical protein
MPTGLEGLTLSLAKELQTKKWTALKVRLVLHKKQHRSRAQEITDGELLLLILF